MNAPRYADTGQGANRRRLTLEEARAGLLPAPTTPEEWAAMNRASAEQGEGVRRRTAVCEMRRHGLIDDSALGHALTLIDAREYR